MDNSKSKILITGATGFIGEHVIHHLLNNNCTPALLGRNPNKVHPQFKHLEFHKTDLLDMPAVANVLKHYDTIIHLAGRTGAGHIEDPLNDCRINALGSLNLFKAAAEQRIKKIVSMSSYEVYNPSSNFPIDEECPRAPLTPYAVSLHMRELYAKFFYQTAKLDISTLCLFNVYGPAISSHNKKGLIPYLVDQALSNKPITISAHPKTARDFVHVYDVADIIFKIILDEKIHGQYFNVGTGKITTFEELAHHILKIAGSDLKIDFKFQESKLPVSQICANIKNLKNTLKYDIKHHLIQSLTDIIKPSQKS